MKTHLSRQYSQHAPRIDINSHIFCGKCLTMIHMQRAIPENDVGVVGRGFLGCGSCGEGLGLAGIEGGIQTFQRVT